MGKIFPIGETSSTDMIVTNTFCVMAFIVRTGALVKIVAWHNFLRFLNRFFMELAIGINMPLGIGTSDLVNFVNL